MKKTWLKAAKWMLVALFMSYHISSTCFYHTHHYSWGTVTHSHLYSPFSEHPAQHNHSQIQCLTIQILSHFVLLFLTTAVFCKIVHICRIYIPVCRYKVYLLLIASPLRAPPALN
ncbi:MAG: hypothetical protein LBT76_05930 [Tannerella sp.]|nr:hypothetical protein [Tannerella sp.]